MPLAFAQPAQSTSCCILRAAHPSAGSRSRRKSFLTIRMRCWKRSAGNFGMSRRKTPSAAAALTRLASGSPLNPRCSRNQTRVVMGRESIIFGREMQEAERLCQAAAEVFHAQHVHCTRIHQAGLTQGDNRSIHCSNYMVNHIELMLQYTTKGAPMIIEQRKHAPHTTCRQSDRSQGLTRAREAADRAPSRFASVAAAASAAGVSEASGSSWRSRLTSRELPGSC